MHSGRESIGERVKASSWTKKASRCEEGHNAVRTWWSQCATGERRIVERLPECFWMARAMTLDVVYVCVNGDRSVSVDSDSVVGVD